MDESLELYGDFNTANTKILFLSFESCDPTIRKTCKNENEFKEWLKKKVFSNSLQQEHFCHRWVQRKDALEICCSWLDSNWSLVI